MKRFVEARSKKKSGGKPSLLGKAGAVHDSRGMGKKGARAFWRDKVEQNNLVES